MSEQLQHQEETCSDNNSKIIIECDPDGVISFSCEWMADQSGISSIGSILSILSSGDICNQIINSLYSDCETEEEESAVEKLSILYEAIQKINSQNNKILDNEVILTPIEAAMLM